MPRALVWASNKNLGTFRLCENNSTRRRGARLIQAGCYLRNKDSSRQHVRFFYCAFTTSRGVFTQPAPGGLFFRSGITMRYVIDVRFWQPGADISVQTLTR